LGVCEILKNVRNENLGKSRKITASNSSVGFFLSNWSTDLSVLTFYEKGKIENFLEKYFFKVWKTFFGRNFQPKT